MPISDNNTITTPGRFARKAGEAIEEWRDNSCAWVDNILLQPDPVEMNMGLSTTPQPFQVQVNRIAAELRLAADRERIEPPVDGEATDEPAAPASSAYIASTNEFYRKLIHRGQLLTVAAPTGQGKSLLATNCAAHVIQNGGRVLWANLEMGAAITNNRLVAMLDNLPADTVKESPQYTQARIRELAATDTWRVLDIMSAPRTVAQWEHLFDTCTAMRPLDLLVIDGFDRVASGLTAQEFGERCDYAAAWAKTMHTCLIATSQTTRGSVNAEILDVDDLAFSAGKSYASDVVATIGHGELNELRIVCVVKDRERLFGGRQVFRLGQTPSLRLVVMDVDDPIPVCESDQIHAPIFVNCTGLEALGDVDNGEGEADDETNVANTKLYHGTGGHVSIGREIFKSATFKSGDWVALGRLLSLYEMATFHENTLHAPGTKIPVTIQRGQLMTSLRILGNQWDMDKKGVERLLDRLAADGLVTLEHVFADRGRGRLDTTSDTRRKKLATVVTLCHYDTNSGANAEYGRGNDTTHDTIVPRS